MQMIHHPMMRLFVKWRQRKREHEEQQKEKENKERKKKRRNKQKHRKDWSCKMTDCVWVEIEMSFMDILTVN